MRFSLIHSPYMQKFVLREIQELAPRFLGLDGRPLAFEYTVVEGQSGETILDCNLEFGLQLNFLKSVTRVLMEIGTIQATEFHQFESGLRRISKKTIIPFSNLNKAHISVSQSKLGQEKRLEKIVHDIFPKTNKNLDIYIYGYQDHFKIQWDLSGEALYKRGYKIQSGIASLRESWAWLGIYLLVDQRAQSDFNNITLLDPMVGSGSFLLEATHWGIPWIFRQFSMDAWSELPAIFIKRNITFSHYVTQWLPKWGQMIGIDIDENQLEDCRQNFNQLESQISIQSPTLVNANSLEYIHPISKDSEVWIISNPPFGLRLKKQLSSDELISIWLDLYKPKKIVLLLPRSERPQKNKGDFIEFDLGGQPVGFFVWRRP